RRHSAAARSRGRLQGRARQMPRPRRSASLHDAGRRLALVTARMSQQHLESYLWGAAIILRGLVDAGDYKQFIFPLVFFKRLSDVWDEDHAIALAESKGDADYATATANDRFVIPDGSHWNDV